jgi:tetratricopeptide (TPR) repeat protein
MCEYMVERYGFEKIVAMLKAYGEDKQTEQVLSEVLGISPAEYDDGFREWVGRYVSGYRLFPRWSKKALTKFRERAAEDPKDVDALAKIAWAYFQRGNSVDALSWLGRAWALDPKRPDLLALRGRVAMSTGRKDKAREWYGKYLDAGGDDFDTRMHLAKLAEEENAFDQAFEHIEAAHRAFPPSPGPLLEIARLKQGEGDLPGAMEALADAARRMNTDIPVRMKLAAYYEENEDWAKLAEVLEEVVLIYPLAAEEDASLTVHARLARALARLKRNEDAAFEFEVALELGVPREAEADVRAELAAVLLLLGRTKDAEFHAKAALDIAPGHAGATEVLERVRAR